MFENHDEEQAKDFIKKIVEEYYNKFHATDKIFDIKKNNSIPYASRIYNQAEMINLVDSALEFWLTSGRYTDIFQKGLADYLGVKYCLLVNSGSSANLLAFMALTSPILGERAIRRGDEVITVAAGFPTTVSPIIQYGAVPVFVDVIIPQYNIDTNMLEEAYSDRTKAVMVAHTLGNPFDISKVKDFCDKHKLWLIEDNCDALGAEYRINGRYKKTGSIGHIGTSSFYPPHHMTMGEGGAVYTNDFTLNKILKSLRDWGRDCSCPSGKDNFCGHRFDKKYGELPFGYDHKYVYSHFGYNLKATDMQAAIGVAQLEKLPSFVECRRKNYSYLRESLKELSDYFVLPEPCIDSIPSWFGFLLTCTNKVNRNNMVNYLENHGIQTRMLFAGNIIKHPCFTLESEVRYRKIGELANTDRIMNDTFWIGVYPGMSEEMLQYMVNKIKSAINFYK